MHSAQKPLPPWRPRKPGHKSSSTGDLATYCFSAVPLGTRPASILVALLRQQLSKKQHATSGFARGRLCVLQLRLGCFSLFCFYSARAPGQLFLHGRKSQVSKKARLGSQSVPVRQRGEPGGPGKVQLLENGGGDVQARAGCSVLCETSCKSCTPWVRDSDKTRNVCSGSRRHLSFFKPPRQSASTVNWRISEVLAFDVRRVTRVAIGRGPKDVKFYPRLGRQPAGQK